MQRDFRQSVGQKTSHVTSSYKNWIFVFLCVCVKFSVLRDRYKQSIKCYTCNFSRFDAKQPQSNIKPLQLLLCDACTWSSYRVKKCNVSDLPCVTVISDKLTHSEGKKKKHHYRPSVMYGSVYAQRCRCSADTSIFYQHIYSLRTEPWSTFFSGTK